MEPGKGIVIIDITIEFGKTAKFNFGIAAGELSFRAGFYFRKRYDDIEFKAYVIAKGHIKILGTFGFSIYFHLILRYKNGLLEGDCLLVLKKDFGLFDVTFRVHIRMTFLAPKEQQSSGSLQDQKQQYALNGRQSGKSSENPLCLRGSDSFELALTKCDTAESPEPSSNQKAANNQVSPISQNNNKTKRTEREENYKIEDYYNSYYII